MAPCSPVMWCVRAEKPDCYFLHCASALWWVTKRTKSPLPSAPRPGSAHLSLFITAKPKTPTWSRSLLGWGNPCWVPARFTALSRVPFSCYWLLENVMQHGGVRHAHSLLFSLFITHSAPASSIKALAPRWEGQRVQSERLPCGWSSSLRPLVGLTSCFHVTLLPCPCSPVKELLFQGR